MILKIKNNIIFLLILVFFGSLTVDSKQTVKYYKDFDLFTMKGVVEIKDSLVMPYVKVIYNVKEKPDSISYHLFSGYVSRIEFLKNDTLLISKYIDEDDLLIYYTFYSQNKIIVFTYNVKGPTIEDKGALMNVSVLKKKINGEIQETFYYFSLTEKTYFEPTPDEKKIPYKKAKKIKRNKINLIDGKIYKESNIKKGASEMTECYFLNGLSYNWWAQFPYIMEKCPGKNVPAPGNW